MLVSTTGAGSSPASGFPVVCAGGSRGVRSPGEFTARRVSAVDTISRRTNRLASPPAPGGIPRFADPAKGVLAATDAENHWRYAVGTRHFLGLVWRRVERGREGRHAGRLSPSGWSSRITLAGRADFQYHHQPFNYFASFAPGTRGPGRSICEDYDGRSHRGDRRWHAAAGGLLQAAGQPERAPGLHRRSVAATSTSPTSIAQLQKSPQWARRAAHRHLRRERRLLGPRPAAGGRSLGPGTRIPAIIVSPYAKNGFVDHTSYDTTSIIQIHHAALRASSRCRAHARPRPAT